MQGTTQPQTLVRAARDIALRALDLMLQGYGYKLTTADVISGFYAFKAAAEAAGDWPVRCHSFEMQRVTSQPA